jgi:hypothetical protein
MHTNRLYYDAILLVHLHCSIIREGCPYRHMMDEIGLELKPELKVKQESSDIYS